MRDNYTATLNSHNISHTYTELVSRQLPDEVIHQVSKALTQRLERTNGIVRQQTGRWHRRQNKFGKVWQQSAITLRLVLT